MIRQVDSNQTEARDNLAFDRSGTTPSSSNTLYTYNKTQQTSKATTAGSVTTTQTFSYNRQGLMASVITESSNENVLKRVDYSYDTGGQRVLGIEQTQGKKIQTFSLPVESGQEPDQIMSIWNNIFG